jgi:hypothetical protein
MQRKTSDYYEAEIRKLYPEVHLLQAYCDADPEDTETAKELEQKKATLRAYRDKWAQRKPVKVFVANNEGLPNTSEELGYPTEPMKQYDAKKWPYYQVGDYQAYVDGVGWYPVCRERKTLADLYATLMDRDHRKNLYEEHGRFSVDPRYKKDGIFRFDLECTEKDFFEYLPPWPKQCRFCEVKRVKTESGDYWCPRSHELFPSKENEPDFRCHNGFKERSRDPVDIKRIRTTQHTIIRQCHELGMQIVWRGSREAAYGAYRSGVEEWLKLNYVSLLRLEEINEEAFLKERLALAEEDVRAAKCSLKMLFVEVLEVDV